MLKPSAAFLCFVVLCATAFADELSRVAPDAVGMDAEMPARIDEQVNGLIDAGKSAGAVVVVVRHGRVVYEEAFGRQNIAEEAPMRIDSLFRIYSMTKPITSTAVMMLVEEGKIDLDDPVHKYIEAFASPRVFVKEANGKPVFAEAEQAITLRDLLRHTAGMTYGAFADTYVDGLYKQAGVLSPDQDLPTLISKLASLPLTHQPGTIFNYGMSIDVLGRVIEIVSKQPLDEFLQKRILDPLDMYDTAFSVPEGSQERFAANYGPAEGGGLVVIDDPATSRFLQRPQWLSGGGGLVSTARDYIRFCQMFLNKGEWDGQRLLKVETVADMMTNRLPDSAYPIAVNGGEPRPGIGFGYGFSVVVEQVGDAVHPVGECRWGGAASTHFWISPKHDVAVVALQQKMPFTFELENAIRPVVYEAIGE